MLFEGGREERVTAPPEKEKRPEYDGAEESVVKTLKAVCP